MIKTRFDNDKTWIDSSGYTVDIAAMDTAHLINILRMFIAKPHRTMAMLVTDIERCVPWTPDGWPDPKVESLRNATSLTADDLRLYALDSNLGTAIVAELQSRGVNTDNVLEVE